jgi:predicted Zn-ribbon and HTH transcriptional regulator
MNEKRMKIEEFISTYHKLTQQEKELLFIQEGLNEKKGISLDCKLTVNGKTFALHELSGESQESIFESFEEDLSLFITYLLKMNQMKIEDLIYSVSCKEEEKSQEQPPTEEAGISEINTEEETIASTLSFSKATDLVLIEIEKYEKESIINPSVLYDNLDKEIQEQVALSDVHDLLRDYVDQDKMKIIHNATCFKCTSGYEQDYEKLPRDVSCGHCGADIVNIEIRYKKLY